MEPVKKLISLINGMTFLNIRHCTYFLYFIYLLTIIILFSTNYFLNYLFILYFIQLVE